VPTSPSARLRLRPRDPGPRWDIQGLRAFAVVAVVANHLLGWPRGGFVGVDVFFVLSGFLITGLLLREHERTGRISFLGFYRRRVKRILPALVLVLLVTEVVAWLVLSASRWRDVLADGAWSLLFAGNWRFALQSTDYFAQNRAVSPLQHYWSLGVEEQFYLVWPWLLLLVFVLLRKRPRYARLAAGAAIAVLSAASLLWALRQTRADAAVAYFSTFTRAWELGLGALVAVAAPAFARLPARVRPVLAWLGLAAMVVSLFTVRPDAGFPAPGVALPVLATVVVLVAGTGVSQQRLLFPLTNRVSGYLGDISYSLYLWHFPVIILGKAVFGDGPLVLAALLGTAVLLAVYSFHLVEDPIRRSGWLTRQPRRRHRRRRRSSLPTLSRGYKWGSVSLLALVVLGLVATAAFRTSTTSSAAAPAPAVSIPAAPGQPKTDPAVAALQTQIVAALQQTRWPKLDPTLDEAMDETKVFDDVRLCGSSKRDADRCVWGDPSAGHTLVTVGNSLGVVYSRTLRTALGNDDWRLVPDGMYGCPFGDPAVQPIAEDRSGGCADRVQESIDTINRLKPDVVVLSGVRSAEAVVSSLAKVTVPVRYVVLPGPPDEKDVGECYTRTSKPSDCVSAVADDWGQRERALARRIDATFVDTSAWFCVGGRCPSFVGTVPTKIDRYHMSAEYSDRIAPLLRAELDRQGVLSGKVSKRATS
jgi:peptidoglycan/LPS O-acetylase OafA/YrhL